MAREVKTEVRTLEAVRLYGLWVRSTLVTAEIDGETLAALYTAKLGGKGPEKCYVIRDKVDEAGCCDLFAGGTQAGEGLDEYLLPAGEYIAAPVIPKFGFMWGGAMDNADRYLQFVWPAANAKELENFRVEIRCTAGAKLNVELMYKLKRQ